MSSSSLAYNTRRVPLATRLGCYRELAKPRITAMVLVAVAAGMFVGGWLAPAPWLILKTLVGAALVATSTSAFNQWLERRVDARMPRTADRPLPSSRMGEAEVVAFGLVTLFAGLGYLAWQVTWAAAGVALLIWTLYVWAYTPLKTRTTLNTAVGAVGGALPTVLGWAATGEPFRLEVAVLFMILYLWQFPHVMAIGWLYREDYKAAGIKLLPTIDATGRLAGRQAVLAAAMLVPVSLVPALLPAGMGGAAPLYFAWALVLSGAYLAFALKFLARREDDRARSLLRVSLVYLPLMLLLLTIVPRM